MLTHVGMLNVHAMSIVRDVVLYTLTMLCTVPAELEGLIKGIEGREILSSAGLSASPERSKWLAQLKQTKPRDIGGAAGVQAVVVESSKSVLNDVSSGTGVVLIRSFYDKLLRALWRQQKVVLTGNPGIGKVGVLRC